MEGVRGSGIEGNIAIDDVTIEEGECKDSPSNSENLHSVNFIFWFNYLKCQTAILTIEPVNLSDLSIRVFPVQRIMQIDGIFKTD